MQDEKLNDFVLVGGTALSLRIGHRISIDLDLFSKNDFDQSMLQEHLNKSYNFTADYIERNTLKENAKSILMKIILILSYVTYAKCLTKLHASNKHNIGESSSATESIKLIAVTNIKQNMIFVITF